MLFERSRGTLQSPTNVQINDPLGELLFAGYSQGGMGYGGGDFCLTLMVHQAWYQFLQEYPLLQVVQLQTRAERLTVKASGKIGINNIDPQEQCDVTGNIKASGSIQVGTNLDVASSNNAGSTRYRVIGDSSVWERSTQIGATTFEWQVETKNEW